MQGIVADSSSFTSVPRPTLPGAGASPSVARRSYAQQRMRCGRPPLRIGTAARVDPIGLSYSTPVTIWVQRSEDRITGTIYLHPLESAALSRRTSNADILHRVRNDRRARSSSAARLRPDRTPERYS